MRKQILFSIIGILCLLSVTTTIAYSTMAESSPEWLQCTGIWDKAQIVSAGVAGNDYVTISWIYPKYSWEYFAGCERFGFSSVNVQIYVLHPGFVALTSSYTVSNPISYLTIFVHEEICVKGICTYLSDYRLQSGDRVAVTITALYGGGLFQHPTNLGYGI